MTTPIELPSPRQKWLLRAAQWAGCLLVAWAGIHTTARMTRPADVAALAVRAMDMGTVGVTPVAVDAALEVAQAGLSQVQVVVERNDTLDRIFRRLQLSLTDLASLLKIEDAHAALSRLRPGDLITFEHRDGELMGLERQLSLNQTLKITRADSGFVANIEEVPLEHRVVTTGAEIESSLYMAGAAADLTEATTLELAEIFRWDIDFVLDLRAGDSFTLVYEQLWLDGRKVGDGDVLAAEFVNDGRRYRAVRYVHENGKADYYTPDGASLRKAFLKAPVQFSRISSVFNPRRKHPVLNRIRAHTGTDYAAPTGTPVRAAGAGRVRFRGVKGGYGNVVEIEHAGQVVTRYGHLSRFAKGLSVGDRVEQGALIAYVGSTGLATGPHLHFEYMQRGVYLDPVKAIRKAEPGPPIAESIRPDFLAQTSTLVASLDNAGAKAIGSFAAR